MDSGQFLQLKLERIGTDSPAGTWELSTVCATFGTYERLLREPFGRREADIPMSSVALAYHQVCMSVRKRASVRTEQEEAVSRLRALRPQPGANSENFTKK